MNKKLFLFAVFLVLTTFWLIWLSNVLFMKTYNTRKTELNEFSYYKVIIRNISPNIVDAYWGLYETKEKEEPVYVNLARKDYKNKKFISSSKILEKSDNDDELIMDVIVPFFLTTLMTKDRILAYNKFLIPKPRKIIFMTETPFSCNLLHTFANNVYCIPMYSLSSWTIPEIKKTYANITKTKRHGWFIQQFAKLFISLPDIGLSENFLIIDSDNLLLKPFEVMRKVKTIDGQTHIIQSPLYNVDFEKYRSNINDEVNDTTYEMKVSNVYATYSNSTSILQYLFYAGPVVRMWFRDYGPTTGTLLGYYPFVTMPLVTTMVPHWMVFNKKYVKLMLHEITFRLYKENLSDIYKIIFERSNMFNDKQLASTMSEYELYSTWMVRNHPEQINFNVKSLDKFTRNPTHIKDLKINKLDRSLHNRCFLDEEDIEYYNNTLKLDYITWEEEKLLKNNQCHDANQSPQIEIEHRKKERDLLFNYHKIIPNFPKLVISVWHGLQKTSNDKPNQFLLDLLNTFKNLGIKVFENQIPPDCNIVILNAHLFNIDKFHKIWDELGWERRSKMLFIHRLETPHVIKANISRLMNLDRKVMKLNQVWANVTVHQSLYAWTAWDLSYKDYHQLKHRVLIRNAPDPYIFKPKLKSLRKLHHPIRIASTAKFGHWMQGKGSLGELLLNNLNPNDYELWFKGTISPEIENGVGIRYFPSGNAEEVASFLSECDIFIAPMKRESSSQSLIEAISIGLPILYRDEGDHPELVGFGGVPFNKDEDILPAIREITENYEAFASMVGMPLQRDIYGIAAQYIDVFRGREPGSMLEY